MSRVSHERRDGVGWIRLCSPERHNAFDLQAARELSDAAWALGADPEVRALVLTGEGPSFSVGGDIKEFVAHLDDLPEHIERMTSAFHEAILRLHEMPAPVIVGVNGLAAGGGLSLVCLGDLVVACRSARLVAAYTRSGLSPDGGITWFLPELVGRARAFELLVDNRLLTAEDAVEIGLVNQVVDDDAFEEALAATARRVAELPGGVAGRVRGLLRSRPGLEDRLRAEAASMVQSVRHPETLRRLREFVAARGGRQTTGSSS